MKLWDIIQRVFSTFYSFVYFNISLWFMFCQDELICVCLVQISSPFMPVKGGRPSKVNSLFFVPVRKLGHRLHSHLKRKGGTKTEKTNRRKYFTYRQREEEAEELLGWEVAVISTSLKDTYSIPVISAKQNIKQ